MSGLTVLCEAAAILGYRLKVTQDDMEDCERRMWDGTALLSN
jgi:hypothetical protein